VALVGLAPLVRDIVHSLIASERDMSVAAIIEHSELASLRAREPADVYVVGVGTETTTATCGPLLGEPAPPRRVIGISDDGRQMHVSELRPSTAVLGSLSSNELLEVIRETPH
jgi:hypothetical protein